jgi:AcrR family transcriptional regulator
MAALELYLEQGFDQTTVAEIAGRAGLTERTFFRHFADKREVLFSGGATFQNLITSTAAQADAELGPLDAAMAGFEAVGPFFQERRALVKQRHRVIAANAELQERELIKLRSLALALADTLRGRGVGDPTADLISEVAVAVFKTSFEVWVTDAKSRDLAEIIRHSLRELRSLASIIQPKER